MKQRKQIPIPNLAELSFAQALDLAYQVCKFSTGRTYEDLAEMTGKGKETIYRYFTDPYYNPPTHFLPKLCKALGNNLLIEWLCIQADGYFVECGSEEHCNAVIDREMAQLTKEFSDVLLEYSKGQLDGEFSIEELSMIQKEIIDLQKKAEQIRMMLSRVK